MLNYLVKLKMTQEDINKEKQSVEMGDTQDHVGGGIGGGGTHDQGDVEKGAGFKKNHKVIGLVKKFIFKVTSL